jgi:hypothetical protein
MFVSNQAALARYGLNVTDVEEAVAAGGSAQAMSFPRSPYANYAVVRLKETLWGGSYIGVMGIEKRSGDKQDSFNQTGGIDTRLVFLKDWFVDAHMAGTQSPGYPSGNSDLGASLSYRSNWLEGIFECRKIGPNFIPEVGFIERNDANEFYGDLTFKVRPKVWGIREMQSKGYILHAPTYSECCGNAGVAKHVSRRIPQRRVYG